MNDRRGRVGDAEVARRATAVLQELRKQEAGDELIKSIDLGPLGEYFKLVTAERRADAGRRDFLVLKLEAKQTTDTSALHFQAGFFDKDNHLYAAVRLRFGSGPTELTFPLEKGESVEAVIWSGHDLGKWKRIALRKVSLCFMSCKSPAGRPN